MVVFPVHCMGVWGVGCDSTRRMRRRTVAGVVWYFCVVWFSPAKFLVKNIRDFRCFVTMGSLLVSVRRMLRMSYFMMVVFWIVCIVGCC